MTLKQLSKLQEEWDKETPKVSIYRVMRLNAKEWWIILIGEGNTCTAYSVCPFLVSEASLHT